MENENRPNQIKEILECIVINCGDCKTPLVEINIVESNQMLLKRKQPTYKAIYTCHCYKCGGSSYAKHIDGITIIEPIQPTKYRISLDISESKFFGHDDTMSVQVKTKKL